MKRRDFLSGLGSGLAATTLAAPAIAQQRSIAWITHPVIHQVTGNGELLRRFEQDSGIRVDVVTFPGDTLVQRITTELVSGRPSFDVLSISDAIWTESLVRHVEPLDPFVSRAAPPGGLTDFSPAMIQHFRVPQTQSGTIYGLPQRMGSGILFYRTDLLQEAGVGAPQTLEQYYEAAKKIAALPGVAGRQDFHPIIFQGIQSQQGVLDWYDWAAPAGGELLTPPDWRQAAFNAAPGKRALELRRRLIQERLVNQGVLSLSFDDAINAMAQGRAAMSIMFFAYWARLADPQSSTVVGKIGYAPAPRDPGVEFAYPARGWALMIARASQRKDPAWEFVRWLTAPEQQLWMAVNHGNPVSRVSVANDPAFARAVPVAPILGDVLRHGKIMPNAPGLPRVYDVIARHINAAQAGAATVDAALAAAESEVNAILRR
jgi:multiple sugar transport system substrate-binding protein